MMRFYSLTDEHVLQMPLPRFWLLNRNIDRISAQEDYRKARVALMGNATKDSAQSYFSELQKEIGQVVEKDSTQPDYEGLSRLKALAGSMKPK